ncbi:MAG TPA: hypothetical protein VKT72_06235 [Candidatus Baltobacteraceae bacterium]|nr:hypothetical protein [Candidatus Baltobacteraceae bacterium]
MKRILFVSNGHGEIAIAARIAAEVQSRGPALCDHLALVGDVRYPTTMREVGPRRALPSGGVIAMGNVRNIARDLRAGLVSHTLAQLRFLRGARGSYDAAVAVGDIFALVMARQARARETIFVGTAKSVHVAPYGTLERRVMRGADAVFVRDADTAADLKQRGLSATPANVIVDLYAAGAETIDVPFDPLFAVFPGSRESAYDDASMLAQIVRAVVQKLPGAGGAISIAPGIDAQRMCARLERDGWRAEPRDDARAPFALYDGDREMLRAWTGSPGAMLQRARLVLGQAGTANEAAAAMGVPVVSFARAGETRTPWYRRRQMGLLGDAMLLATADPQQGAAQVLALLEDAPRRDRMSAIGRQRMGSAGGAAQVAARIAAAVTG